MLVMQPIIMKKLIVFHEIICQIIEKCTKCAFFMICTKRMTHIRYIDGNNLYGSQMLFDLQTNDYRVEGKTFTKIMEKKSINKEAIDISKRGMF